jgi:hypothetical protein
MHKMLGHLMDYFGARPSQASVEDRELVLSFLVDDIVECERITGWDLNAWKYIR